MRATRVAGALLALPFLGLAMAGVAAGPEQALAIGSALPLAAMGVVIAARGATAAGDGAVRNSGAP